MMCRCKNCGIEFDGAERHPVHTMNRACYHVACCVAFLRETRPGLFGE